MNLKKATLLLIGGLLSSCQQSFVSKPIVSTSSQAPVEVQAPQLKVGMLLPLSGAYEEIGRSLLNAAQMAFVHQSDDDAVLVSFDTQSTEAGAVQAFREAKEMNIIVGPLTSLESKAIDAAFPQAPQLRLSFSNDRSSVSHRTVVCGFLPDDQIGALVKKLSWEGKNTALVLPENSYGETVAALLTQSLQQKGYPLPQVLFYQNLQDISGDLAAALASKAPEAPFDQIIVPESGQALEEVVAALQRNGDRWLAPNVEYVGMDPWRKSLPLWIQEQPHRFVSLPRYQWVSFSQQYQKIFLAPPHPIAGLAYDVVAMILSSWKKHHSYALADFQKREGYSGVYGVFRLTPHMTMERLVEVSRIHQNQVVVVDPAPIEFFSQN